MEHADKTHLVFFFKSVFFFEKKREQVWVRKAVREASELKKMCVNVGMKLKMRISKCWVCALGMVNWWTAVSPASVDKGACAYLPCAAAIGLWLKTVYVAL